MENLLKQETIKVSRLNYLLYLLSIWLLLQISRCSHQPELATNYTTEQCGPLTLKKYYTTNTLTLSGQLQVVNYTDKVAYQG